MYTQMRLLCFHEWLDNRASFLPMLPYMHAVECVAVNLAGHSMGGSISLMAANAFPERVQSLTMIDSLHPEAD
jgi:pimeloyl-ACP methyl ester carboxylesterase